MAQPWTFEEDYIVCKFYLEHAQSWKENFESLIALLCENKFSNRDKGSIMKILIKSRKTLEAMAKNSFQKGTAVISITDVNDAPVFLENEPDYLLRIAFDDVDNDVFDDEFLDDPSDSERERIEKKYHMISNDQARDIASFYLDHKEKISILICQCEHGQSRSAAVASAILEFKSRRGIQIFADDRYYPNKVVFRRVLEALKDQIPVY